MGCSGWRVGLVLLSLAVGCGLSVESSRAADPRNADPEQGKVDGGAYVNQYFGLRYPLPPGWQAGPQPPRPSADGYYVLSTPTPPRATEATILVAAVDTLFSRPTITDAQGMARDLRGKVSAPGEAAATTTVTIAGRSFVRVNLPGTPLSRLVFATDIRCHVVIFVFTSVEAADLRRLGATLQRLTIDRGTTAPICVRNYATAQTVLHQTDPIFGGTPFAKIAVRIIIAEDGKVGHIHVLRADPTQQQRTEEALSNWRFEPYRASGHAAPVETGLTFEFKPP